MDLRHYPRVLRQPGGVFIQRQHSLFPNFLVLRRGDVHVLELPVGGVCEHRQRVCAAHFTAFGESAMLQIELDRFNWLAVQVGEAHERRAAAQRLDAHRARPGEHIPPGGVRHVARQDVEQRLLHAVGDRARRVAWDGFQLAAFGRARDNAESHNHLTTEVVTTWILPCGAMTGTTHPVDRMKRRPRVC